jgi:hypothetical protein
MTGKLRPRFRSVLDDVTDLEGVVEPPKPPPVGTPVCPRCGGPGRAVDEYCRRCGMSMAKAPRYGINGPRDGVWMTPGPHGSLIYKPIGRRATLLKLVVRLAIFVALVLLGLHAIVIVGFFTFLPTVPGTTAQWVDWIDRFDVELGVIIVTLCITAAWWTSRAYRNLPPMQVVDLRVPTSLARVAWIIPVLNLWLSKVVLDDLWRTSDDSVGLRSDAWKKVPAPLASHVGWVGVIGASLLVPLSILTMPDDLNANLPEFRPSILMGAAGCAMLLLGLGVLLALVDQITDRQQARVDRLGTSPWPLPFAVRAGAPSVAAVADTASTEPVESSLKHVKPGQPVWGSY